MPKKAINVTLEESTIDLIDRAADYQLRSRSNMLEYMVKEWLLLRNKPDAKVSSICTPDS